MTKVLESVSLGSLFNVGDVDGPGASACFGLLQWLAVVGDDIYFIDEGNRKLKKVANDFAYIVKMVVKLSEGVYYVMIVFNGKLYTLANNSTSEGFIFEIDPALAVICEVIKGRSATFESSGSINVSGFAIDGKGLFII